jgi:integrase
MPPPASGTIESHVLADGSRAFHLRFRVDGERARIVLHERAGCGCGCGGGWAEPRARHELGDVVARVRAGVWEPPKRTGAKKAPVAEVPGVPTFHEYASAWLRGKVDGVLGESPIDPNTQSDYRWRLIRHLLPFFAKYRLDEIDRDLCLAFKAHKLQESSELQAALAAGADLRDKRGRAVKPLGPSSIRKLIDTLTAILEEAVEDELIERNPARGKRMKVRVPRPPRTFLEMDELAALLEAAEDQERSPLLAVPVGDTHRTRDRVARLAAAGRRPTAIAAELGLAKSTVTHHLRHLGAANAGPYLGRRAIVEMLARSGVRVSELCDVRLRDVRLHDPDGSRFRIPDAKTEAGIREVQMTPDLADVLTAHLRRVQAAGHPIGPDAFLFPNVRGGRIARQRVGKILNEAAMLASERLAQQGRAPLPATTPHMLRRTYISIALVANGFDVKWVMSQVGHANSKMTMDVYAQLEQRVDRRHGTAFDELLRNAKGQHQDADWATIGPRAGAGAEMEAGAARSEAKKKPAQAGLSEVARPRLELGTPRFSVVCSTS